MGVALHRAGCGAVLAGLVTLASPAFADRDATDAARIDWPAGRIVAGGTGVADRHAPSPAVALGTSRRGAELAARHKLAVLVPKLPLAAGGTVADKLPAAQPQLDAVLDAAIAIDAEPETDGSWHVTLAVPLEAIRLALDPPAPSFGGADARGHAPVVGAPRALPAAGDTDPPVVIVEHVTAKPAIGWTVDGTAAATLWLKDVPAWAKDAPRAKAAQAGHGAIKLAAPAGGPSTLYLLISGK